MLNPLLHPNHSSAPTSPVCTRSVLSGRRSNNTFGFGGNGVVSTAPHSPLIGYHSSGSTSTGGIIGSHYSASIQSSSGFVRPVLLRAVPGSVLRRRRVDIQNGANGKERRLCEKPIKRKQKYFLLDSFWEIASWFFGSRTEQRCETWRPQKV